MSLSAIIQQVRAPYCFYWSCAYLGAAICAAAPLLLLRLATGEWSNHWVAQFAYVAKSCAPLQWYGASLTDDCQEKDGRVRRTACTKAPCS